MRGYEQFVDGLSYNRLKLETMYGSGGLLDKPVTKSHKDTANMKKEDVDLIVDELEIPRSHAERELSQNNGDVTKALESLIKA
ncbi:hypothetical protein PUNSTDRAFT_71615 [Punctularia strigosozonata HHB-11173 SS5]|uniref:uncharacterized protein n=1 Tax=Punctularia strigosozonata (strain HHB-11173) TaxID=741275 RepID=UPI0004416D12|nr:uncharacterized protein PUNSTDRAFT_71615 [Punctularia strigosozonata HHB-11173 SS5]EIN07007.1 hypothetical protein PUNSTDRAFT_71615 [Punctularia strigosozonata HHB-11173 SS5]